MRRVEHDRDLGADREAEAFLLLGRLLEKNHVEGCAADTVAMRRDINEPEAGRVKHGYWPSVLAIAADRALTASARLPRSQLSITALAASSSSATLAVSRSLAEAVSDASGH